MERIRNFFKDESGVTATEYGLLITLVAVAIIAGATLLGGNLNTLFTNALPARLSGKRAVKTV